MQEKTMTCKGKFQEFGFYGSTKDIGNHEVYLKKVGDFTGVLNPFRITYISSPGIAKIHVGNDVIEATEGMVLGLNAILKTNGVAIELTAADESIFRMNENSEFCLENTINGISPVIYGNIYYKKGNSMIYDYSKYRTSCWCGGNPDTYIVGRVNEKCDIYYSLSKPLEIYEYDEYGQKFTIVSLKSYQKCELSYDFKLKMRKRYTVNEVIDITREDIADIYDTYLLNENWQHMDEFKSKVV